MSAKRRSIDPQTLDAHLVAISEASAACVAAEYRLWDTVAAARAAGVAWRSVGVMVAMSPEGVQRRFSKPPRGRLV